MDTTSIQAGRAAIAATRELRDQARRARERSRQVLADDESRRLRMRALLRAAGGGHSQRSVPDPLQGRDGGPTPTFHWLHGSRPPSPEAPLAVTTGIVGPAHVVVGVVGEVDIATAARLSGALLEQVRAAPVSGVVVADLDGVGFIDAAGLAVLGIAADTAGARGVHFRVANCSPTVLRLLDIVASPAVATGRAPGPAAPPPSG